MTELEVRDQILLYLAELYENPISRTQWKRFAFREAADQQIALNVLHGLVSNLIAEQKEPGVVRLNSIGYRLIEREVARLRAKYSGKPIAQETPVQPPTRDEIRQISEELDRPPDYVSASRIVEGRSEIFWATNGFQKLTGYTVEEINASGGAVMLPGNADIEKLKEIAERLFTGEKVGGDYEIKVKSGHVITLRFVAWPLLDKEGHVIGSLSAARRVTDGNEDNGAPKRYTHKPGR